MRRRGFTILEMLWALLLLGIAAAVGVQVVSKCILAITAERHVAMQESARTSCIRQLRDDVWNCRSLRTTDGSLLLSDGASEVRYTVDGNRVTRLSKDGQTSWELHEPAEFAAEGAAVIVRLGGPDQIVMAAPKLLAGGVR